MTSLVSRPFPHRGGTGDKTMTEIRSLRPLTIKHISPRENAQEFESWLPCPSHTWPFKWVWPVRVCLCVEIQELDSNMQYLVYENHSKFIKASETIREVSNYLLAVYPSTKRAAKDWSQTSMSQD